MELFTECPKCWLEANVWLEPDGIEPDGYWAECWRCEYRWQTWLVSH